MQRNTFCKEIHFAKGTTKSVNDFSSMRLVILFFIVMAAQGLVDEEELRLVCSAQEATIGRVLKGWEKGLIHAHLQKEKYKDISRADRDKIPNFDKLMKSVSNKINAMKRRRDYDANVLPTGKVPRTQAERQQRASSSAPSSKPLLIILRMLMLMVLQVRDQEVPEAREARLAQLREHNAVVNRFVCIFFSSKLQAVVDNLGKQCQN